MTFDPSQFGAVPVQIKPFDPADFGATPIEPNPFTSTTPVTNQSTPSSLMPSQDGFFKNLVKDPIKTLVTKPGTRIAQATVGVGAALAGDKSGQQQGEQFQYDQKLRAVVHNPQTTPEMKLRLLNVLQQNKGGATGNQLLENVYQDQNVQTPFGNYAIEGQKGGMEGVKQIAGDAAKSASYLYAPGGAEAMVGSQGIKQAIIQGAKTGAVSGGLYGAGNEVQQPDATAGSVIKGSVKGAVAGGITGGVIGGGIKVAPIVKNAVIDTFGGDNTAEALAIRKANFGLYRQWKSGVKTSDTLAKDITSEVNKYERQGIVEFNKMKGTLPNIKMPKTNLKGELNLAVENHPNLNASEERTLVNLQKLVDKMDDTSIKGLLDLNHQIDRTGFYRRGDPEYQNSNRVIQEFRNKVKQMAITRAENYDKQMGGRTQFAKQIKKGLADATNRIDFLDKLRANVLGRNPETYVDQSANKVRALINKSADPSLAENTKALIQELEQRIGQFGKFTNEFKTANAAKTLEKSVPTAIKRGIGAATTIGLGALGERIYHHYSK